MKISQNFVAFSEYKTFTSLHDFYVITLALVNLKRWMQPCSSQIQDYGTISMQLTSIWKNKTKNTILDKLHIILRFQKTIKQVPTYYLKGLSMFFYPDFIAILFGFITISSSFNLV